MLAGDVLSLGFVFGDRHGLLLVSPDAFPNTRAMAIVILFNDRDPERGFDSVDYPVPVAWTPDDLLIESFILGLDGPSQEVRGVVDGVWGDILVKAILLGA